MANTDKPKSKNTKPDKTIPDSKIEKINIGEKFNLFKETWSPKVIGELNDSISSL
jgi:hypothetical protein